MNHTFPPAYRMHHLALAPLLGNEQFIQDAMAELAVMNPDELNRFLGFLVYHGLGAHWYFDLKDRLEESSGISHILPQLKDQAFGMSKKYLLQKKKLREIDTLLVGADVPYVIEKGAHAREVLYPRPYVRPCFDIDVLIRKEDKLRVITLFCQAGFTARPKKETISNDLDLRSEGVHIDLHWDVLRPGRARKGLAEELIENRQRYGDHFGPSVDHTMFLMLIHPVFKKYVTTYLALLVRFLDMIKWQELQDIDWDCIGRMAERYGLKTAMWLTGSYLGMLSGVKVGSGFLEGIRPGVVKRSYLNWWLFNNFSEKLFKVPGAVKILFTLAAHDTCADVLRFLKTKRNLDANISKELDEIHNLIEQQKTS